MPAIRMLGRKWLFATDDLVFPSVIEIPFRILWFVVISLVIAEEQGQTWKCASTVTDGWLVRIYLCGILVLQVAMVILLTILTYQSAKGTITDSRKWVVPLLKIHICMILLELLLNIIGTIWIYSDIIECPVTTGFSRLILNILVISTWVRMVILILTIYALYDPLGSVNYEDLHEQSKQAWYNKKLVNSWMWRLKWALLLLERDDQSKEAIEETARLLASLYRSTDLVLSDIFAGCILLRIRQKRLSRQITTDTEDHYNMDMNKMFADAPPWMNLEDAFHYLKLSVAAYGWLHVVYNNLCTGCCMLVPYLRCCCFRPSTVDVIGDNCCMCNYAGLKHISKVDDADIIYVSFTNKVFEVAFYVIADHDKKTIVVTIRGTISVPDVFTDLTGSCDIFEVDGLPKGSRAHKGMALGASKTMQTLQPVLEKAFEKYPDYELVVTGHSLGAAVAVLLGIKLKPIYPNVKVYAFSAPAGLLSREAAKYTESFVMMVGLGDDLVMRLGILSVQNFRDRLIQSLYATKLSKYRIILKSIKYAFATIPESDLDATWKQPDDLETQLLSSPIMPQPYPETDRMFIAGRILHIVRHKPAVRRVGKQPPKYRLRWATPDDFNELQVMPRMLLDHMPENIYDALRNVLEECRANDSRSLRVNIISQ